jgi:carbon storage regulator CsrA
MLVLSRKAGQELVIGEDIRIVVTRVSGNRVTLGISAPDDVRIIRSELEVIVRSFEDDGAAKGRAESPRNDGTYFLSNSEQIADCARQLH